MAKKSCIRKGESVTWDFKVPFGNESSDSPAFEFMNLKWMLKFHLYRDHQTLTDHFSIVLINCDGIDSFEHFEIATTLEYRRSGKQHKCSHLSIKSSYTTLWVEKRDTLEKKMEIKECFGPDIKLSLICVLFLPKEISLGITNKADQTTQLTTECSSCQNKDCPLSVDKDIDNSTIQPSEITLKYLANLESLSKDIGGMFSKSFMADIEFKCGETVILAHTAILAARSEVFSAMFKNKIKTFQNKIIIADTGDIDPSTFQEFLKYLYFGKLSDDLSVEIVSQLYLTSFKYAVQSLQKECSKLMAENLNGENFIGFLKIADAQADQELKDAIADFTAKRPLLLRSDSWINFTNEFPMLAIAIYRNYMEKAFPQ